MRKRLQGKKPKGRLFPVEEEKSKYDKALGLFDLDKVENAIHALLIVSEELGLNLLEKHHAFKSITSACERMLIHNIGEFADELMAENIMELEAAHKRDLEFEDGSEDGQE